MLYLIITFGRSKKQKALKVGYTSNIKNRKLNYSLHNPFCEWIAHRSGSLIDETKMHLYLQSYSLKEKFLNEWFIDSLETRRRFHDSSESINKRIWKYRNQLFKESDFKGSDTIRRQIYEELRMIFGTPKKDLPIDIIWKRDFNKKSLKSIKSLYLD